MHVLIYHSADVLFTLKSTVPQVVEGGQDIVSAKNVENGSQGASLVN